MMLDPLCIVGGILGWNTERQKKVVNRSMASLASFRKPLASGSQDDRPIRFALDQPVAFEARHRTVCRHMTDPEMARDFFQPAYAVGLDEVENGLHVILRDLGGVVFANANVLTGGGRFLWHEQVFPRIRERVRGECPRSDIPMDQV